MIAMYGVLNRGWTWRRSSGSCRCWPIENVRRESPISAGVGGDQEDHRGEDPDVDRERIGEPRAEADVLDDAEHRVVGERGPELGRVVAVGLARHRHRRERDRRQQRVEADHGRDHHPGAAGDRARGVARLLGHVRDRLDPGVRDHPDRDAEREVAPARHGAEVDLADQQVGVEDEREADRDERDLGQQIGDREHDVEARRLLGPLHVQRRQQRDHADAEEDVGRARARADPRRPRGSGGRRRPRSRP